MKNYFILIFLSVSLCSFAQKAIITKIRNGIGEEGNVFPKITIRSDRKLSKIINDVLRKTILDVSPGTADSHILDDLSEDGGMPSMRSLTYKMLHNHKLLSLSVSYEDCGAYCEYHTVYFNFDLNTAKQLAVKDFFTAEGLKKLNDSITHSKNNLITEKINAVREAEKTDQEQLKAPDGNYYNDVIELYSECLERKISEEEMHDYDFAISPGKFHFYTERCSAHFNMALDALWNFEYSSDIKNWMPYLTPLAQKLIKK